MLAMRQKQAALPPSTEAATDPTDRSDDYEKRIIADANAALDEVLASLRSHQPIVAEGKLAQLQQLIQSAGPSGIQRPGADYFLAPKWIEAYEALLKRLLRLDDKARAKLPPDPEQLRLVKESVTVLCSRQPAWKESPECSAPPAELSLRLMTLISGDPAKLPAALGPVLLLSAVPGRQPLYSSEETKRLIDHAEYLKGELFFPHARRLQLLGEFEKEQAELRRTKYQDKDCVTPRITYFLEGKDKDEKQAYFTRQGSDGTIEGAAMIPIASIGEDKGRSVAKLLSDAPFSATFSLPPRVNLQAPTSAPYSLEVQQQLSRALSRNLAVATLWKSGEQSLTTCWAAGCLARPALSAA